MAAEGTNGILIRTCFVCTLYLVGTEKKEVQQIYKYIYKYLSISL